MTMSEAPEVAEQLAEPGDWCDGPAARLRHGLGRRVRDMAREPSLRRVYEQAGDAAPPPTPPLHAGDGACDLLAYRTQAARVEHLSRMASRAGEARAEALAALKRASENLALVREGMRPGFDGDHALRKARDKAERSSVAPVVLRYHPIELMFKRGQLRPEWRWLFEMYHDLSEVAEGGSVGVVDLDRFRVQTGGVPQFKMAQLQAIQELEEEFKRPIRLKAGEKALAVFDLTHRFGRHINSVMGVKQIAAAGGHGNRKAVGQLLQRAYQALADHHGITAARARARFAREPGAVPVGGIVAPLSDAERAEIEAHEAERREAERDREAARYQDGKDRANELQRQRRQGAR